jgi:hypothetical protein
MKNLIKIAFVFVLAVVTLASCSKDQNCVNWLEGDWNITSVIITDANGRSVNLKDSLAATGFATFEGGNMSFGKYDVKNDEFGSLETIFKFTVFTIPSNDTSNLDYKILGDCKTFSTRESGTSSSFDDATILESSSKKMVFETTDSANTKTKITIEK